MRNNKPTSGGGSSNTFISCAGGGGGGTPAGTPVPRGFCTATGLATPKGAEIDRISAKKVG